MASSARSAARSARSAVSRPTPTRSELLEWLSNFARGKQPGDPGFPRRIFLVHGDPEAQIAIEPKVKALGFETKIPHWRERVALD